MDFADIAEGAGVTTSRLPDSYRSAKWRNVTPVDTATGQIGLGFDRGGETLRLALSVESAGMLLDTLRYFLTGNHSDTSSGMESVAVSVPSGRENV